MSVSIREKIAKVSFNKNPIIIIRFNNQLSFVTVGKFIIANLSIHEISIYIYLCTEREKCDFTT